MQISAYVPCYNNAETILAALNSVRQQSVTVDEIFVIDDGSTDNSAKLAESSGFRVIRNNANLGRGAARNLAIVEAKHEIILGCDATNALESNFIEMALPYFESEKVAAVFGRIVQRDGKGVAARWRRRHLFKNSAKLNVDRRALLTTSGAIVRRDAVISVGNFDKGLRHSEDAELGKRLLDAGFEVVFVPNIEMAPLSKNNLSEVLERYWRWYAGKDETVSLKTYLKQIAYSIKVMAAADLKDRDPISVPISLFVPHYQFWRSLSRRKKDVRRK